MNDTFADDIQCEKKIIAVFGSSKGRPGSEDYDRVYQVGKILARRGYILANGGYGGMMEASSRGAAEGGGGQTIGVTCEAFWRGKPNPWIQKEIRTKTLYERLGRLIELADAFVFLPGSTGTLLELAACLELIHKHFLPAMPMIFLGDFWKPVIHTICPDGYNGVADMVFTDSLDQMVERLERYFEK